MPVDSFVPLVGSGFDALAGQREFWNNFSKSVDEDNIRRLGAAQQNQNNYLQQLSQLRQGAVDQDAAAQREATQNALSIAAQAKQAAQNQDNLDRDYQFRSEAQKQTVAAEDRRNKVMEDVAQKKVDFQTKQQEIAIDQKGQRLAQQYSIATQAAKEADSAYEKANQLKDQAQADAESLAANPKKGKEDNLKLAQISKQGPAIAAQLRLAASVKKKSDDHLASLIAQMAAGEFSVEDDGTISHSSGKKWSFKEDLAKAMIDSYANRPAAATGTGTAPAPAPYSGFSAPPTTGTNPPPNVNPVQPAPLSVSPPAAASDWTQVGKYRIKAAVPATSSGTAFGGPMAGSASMGVSSPGQTALSPGYVAPGFGGPMAGYDATPPQPQSQPAPAMPPPALVPPSLAPTNSPVASPATYNFKAPTDWVAYQREQDAKAAAFWNNIVKFFSGGNIADAPAMPSRQ